MTRPSSRSCCICFAGLSSGSTDRPRLVLLDEAWSYLQHALFRNRLRDWLKTMRRKNAVVVMATQQISDIANSEIADVVLENCPTKILLPNAESKNPGSRSLLRTHRVE